MCVSRRTEMPTFTAFYRQISDLYLVEELK
jgi:hypothetical protein